MNERTSAQALMIASLAAVALAAYGFLVGDIWLASTQWLSVAAVLGIYSLWFKVKK